ncbi:hypothetical protein COCNU_07G000120 [Cocos nucifera]|uniref:Alpha-D-phosphohexomutase alpha/beta/alpha domain-containing protein n=1 Tax=Cocos nucifera TaxID=13894 RepID=A0A8K0N3R4_COCNU|nr:hypothetical protein COCNU_07G000120 [Cocos nucifera]
MNLPPTTSISFEGCGPSAQFTSAISSSEKVDILKLQNGSDIRGVAVAGVVGEPVNLTEPATEAIAAAFAEWLLEKKKPAESKHIRVSIGHDSRISAQKLQDAVSHGIASAGVDVIQYGLASTPAMFNSTLTEDENFLCPVDGSIMITGGKHHQFKRGYKNVIDEAVRLNSIGEESYLAIETSGHGALKENHWLDDGAYLMVKLLKKLASARASGSGSGSKVLTDLIEGLEEAAVAVELRLKIDQNHADLKGGSFRDYGEAVLKHLEKTTGSDPKLKKAPINYEGAPSNEDAVKLGLAVLAAAKEFAALEASTLDKFVHQLNNTCLLHDSLSQKQDYFFFFLNKETR